jgi:chaperone BCS1
MDYSSLLNSLITTAALATLYGLWRLLTHLYSIVIYRRTVSLTIHSNDFDAWPWLEHWMQEQKTRSSIQHWRVKHRHILEIATLPEPFLFSFEGHTLRIKIDTYSPAANISIQSYQMERDAQTAVIWTRGTDASIFPRLMKEMKRVYVLAKRDFIALHHSDVSPQRAMWTNDRDVACRSLDSLSLPNGLCEEALRDLAAFRQGYEFYRGRIPYRRGWLLEGPPGNGKSSFVLAIASHLHSDIYHLSLNNRGLDDAALKRLLVGEDLDAAPRIFVLEDIDCLFANRAPLAEDDTDSDNNTSRVTFSGLLNALDGVGSPENTLIIMTTNYPERLDAALIRPGRVDRRFRFEPPDDARIALHYSKFFPEASRLDTDAFVKACRGRTEPLSMSLVQEMILRERDGVQ